jgi:hypothetical protein
MKSHCVFLTAKTKRNNNMEKPDFSKFYRYDELGELLREFVRAYPQLAR